MKRIDQLFALESARSGSFESYEPGKTAFVTNGFKNNGVIGHITTRATDRVFAPPCLVVSAFCEATVHLTEIVARGNGGSGLVVLRPLQGMNREIMLYYAAQINTLLKWKYSYGRMVTKERFSRECLADPPIDFSGLMPEIYIPKAKSQPRKISNGKTCAFKLRDIFDIRSGDFHNASELDDGAIPLVSCGYEMNGIVKFVSVEEQRVYSNVITIAYNGQPLVSHYHPYSFAAKDDVGICIPKNPISISTLLYIVFTINREQWRFSYGRKCFREKLGEQIVLLPSTNGIDIDELTIEECVQSASYWPAFSQRVVDPKPILLSRFLVLGDT